MVDHSTPVIRRGAFQIIATQISRTLDLHCDNLECSLGWCEAVPRAVYFDMLNLSE